MEEKKEKVSQEATKMSYEELNNVAHQLSEQNRQLYSKLREMDVSNMFKRLDYLFRVVENINIFNDEFSKQCIEEIETMMKLPKEEEDANNKE